MCLVLMMELNEAKKVFVSGRNVNIRSAKGKCFDKPSTKCTSLGQVSRKYCIAECQLKGQTIRDPPKAPNPWWSLVRCGKRRGWISNRYLRIKGKKVDGIPACTTRD